MTKKLNVLFLCTGNSCRSQMAEGLTQYYLGDFINAYSAGTQPAGYVHPLAIQVMAELEIDISHNQSKPLQALREIPFDLVITVCDDAAETCPVWLREGTVVHMGFVDPAQAQGPLDVRMNIFREVRDQIREQILTYLTNIVQHEHA